VRLRPQPVGDSVDDALGRASVDCADDLLDRPPPFRSELVRARERALDPVDDLLEALRPVEGAGCCELLVVLADDVLRRPRLARRRALVVEDADGRAIAHERVEEDRARVADDDVDVLEQRREVVEVGVARLLHDDPVVALCRPEALLPPTVARMRAKQELDALCSVASPPCEETLDEGTLVGRVARCVPGDEHDASGGVEPIAAQQLLVLGA